MHNKFLPSKRNGQTLKSSLTTLAVAVMLTGASLDANALALGEINVYSALGQPFRAEVDVTQLSPQEANGLKAAIASQSGYKSAGVEYNPVVAGIRVSVQKRANGKTFLRLTSQSPIHEPYLGIVVDTNWSSGRVVRDFTVLLDPPEAKRTAVEVTSAQTSSLPPLASAPAPARAPVAAPAAPTQSESVSTETQSERDARVSRAMAQANGSTSNATAVAAPREPSRRSKRGRNSGAATQSNDTAPASAQASGDQVNVKRGDTAGRLAAANLPANVSLDQMLVAMLRANPDAFVGGNINRMRAGAVLTLPTAEEASAVSSGAARKTIVAQSRNFNRYRQGLGRNAPRVQAASTSQASGGTVQTEVKAPKAVTTDGSQLIVTHPSGKDASKAEAVAKKAERDAQNQRMAELERTRKELDALTKASQAARSAPPAPVAAPVATPPASVSGVVVPIAPVAPASVPTPALAPASAAADGATTQPASELIALPPVTGASEAVLAASAPASEASAVAEATPPPKPRVLPPPAPPEPSFMDGVSDNPLPWGLGALAVLGGLGFLATRLRKKKAAGGDDNSDSEFIESRLQPDSFFNASGGQQVNTQESRASTGNATSMAYSPSQLDAAGDVDPVAEADVYLAYGRDMQAEEILKEALNTSPDRIAIYRKLLEIYAKRRDTKAFEELAKDLRDRTNGQGEDWLKVADLGNELDPGNSLYKGNGAEALLSKTGPLNAPVFGSSTLPSPDHTGLDESKLDLELNGDSRLLAEDEDSHLHKAGKGGLATFAAPPDTKAPDEDTRDQPLAFDMDFDIPPAMAPTQPSPVAPEPATAPASLRGGLGVNEGMLEFDMGALSVDPDSRSFDAQDSVQPDDEDEDPLATKLSLAREFHAIGDTEGARALVKEVIAEADGAVKARAERFLSELS